MKAKRGLEANSSSNQVLELDKRALMFPVCSGSLDFVNVVMQMVAVATSYWAHFKRERYPQVDLPLNTAQPYAINKPDPLYEEGHYGLWSVCLTVFDGRRLDVEDCSTNIIHFHPSSWRVFAGIIATINVVLSLIFMATIPLQLRHLKNGRPLYCKYKTLTRIKMVLSIVGAICGVMAAVLFGIHSHHKYYKEPKGWSFGLQIIVIIVQVFLIICSSAENVMATRIDEARPKPQFLFTVSGSSNRKHSGSDLTHVHPPPPPPITTLHPGELVASKAKTKKKKERKSREKKKAVEVLTEVVTLHGELSRDNPIYVDSEGEDSIDPLEHPVQGASSRFVVVKVADMYSNSDHEAYDNLGYVANEADNLDSIQSARVTNM